MIRKLVVPPLQGSDVLLNLTQGFALGYFLPPLRGSGVMPYLKANGVHPKPIRELCPVRRLGG